MPGDKECSHVKNGVMRREDEPEEFEIADSYFQELRTWLGFRDSHEAWIPEAGSRLAQDDGLIKPHQASHNIANAVVSAIDHLHALDSIMIGAGASHTLAPFSLIRAAIECAAQAAWILAPEEQATRVVRSLSLSLKVAKDRETAYSELARRHPNLQGTLPDFDSDKAQLQAILDASGAAGKLILPSSTHILTQVRDVVPRTSALSVWQLCSGFAHGRRWAADAVLTPTQSTSLPDDVIVKENRPTMRLLVWALTPAMDLIRYSLERHSELSRA